MEPEEGDTMKLIKRILLGLLIIILIYIIYSGIKYIDENRLISVGEAKTQTGVTVEQIREIAQLASVEYLMEARMIIEKPKIRVWIFDIPQTDKYYVAMAQGKVKAGIDLEQIEILSDSKDELVLRLPKARILDKYIDPATKWEKEFEGLFNQIKAEEVTEAQIKAEEDMVERAIKNGILDRANENAKRIIESLIRMSGTKTVVFE